MCNSHHLVEVCSKLSSHVFNPGTKKITTHSCTDALTLDHYLSIQRIYYIHRLPYTNCKYRLFVSQHFLFVSHTLKYSLLRWRTVLIRTGFLYYDIHSLLTSDHAVFKLFGQSKECDHVQILYWPNLNF